MYYKKTIYLLVLMFLFGLSPSYGQDLLETLGLARTAYQNLENYQGVMTTKSYSAESPDVVIQTTTLTIRKQGNSFWYDLGDIEMLLNSQYLINFNSAEKVLVCNKVNVGDKLQNPVLPDLEDLIKDFNDAQYKGITQNSHCYILRSDWGPVSLLELYFDKNHHLLNKVVYHYQEDLIPDVARVEMTCKHIDLNPHFEASLFSEEKFVQIHGNKVSPQKKYQAYTLILGEGLENVEQ